MKEIFRVGGGLAAGVLLILSAGCQMFSGSSSSGVTDPPRPEDFESRTTRASLPPPSVTSNARTPSELPRSNDPREGDPVYRPVPRTERRDPPPFRAPSESPAPRNLPDEPPPTRVARPAPAPEPPPFTREEVLADRNAAAAAAQPTDRGTTSDLIRIGDEITIRFSGLASPPADLVRQRVGQTGEITLDLINTVKVAGRSVDAVKSEIVSRYVPQYFKRLNVAVNIENRFFHVDGEVKAPGRFPFFEEMKLTTAITTAGGFTEYAKRGDILITRANGTKLTVDYRKAIKNPKEDPDIYPGDHILVRQSPY